MAQKAQDCKAVIELTPDERELVSKIDFNPASAEHHDAEYWHAVGEASVALMRSLIACNSSSLTCVPTLQHLGKHTIVHVSLRWRALMLEPDDRLERIIDLTRDGGRLRVVLPDKP